MQLQRQIVVIQPLFHPQRNRRGARAYALHVRKVAIQQAKEKFHAFMLASIISCSPTSGRMRYAPTPVRLKSGLHWVKIQSQIDRFNHRVIIESNGKYVGAYRIRPPRQRTCPFNDGIMFAAIISFSPSRRRTRSLNDDVLFAALVFIFAHVEGVCPCAPTIFL